jgi:hypothetical protein
MPRREHPDCPDCNCWRPEEGEEAEVYVNGRRVYPGETVNLLPGDRIEYGFTKTEVVAGP